VRSGCRRPCGASRVASRSGGRSGAPRARHYGVREHSCCLLLRSWRGPERYQQSPRGDVFIDWLGRREPDNATRFGDSEQLHPALPPLGACGAAYTFSQDPMSGRARRAAAAASVPEGSAGERTPRCTPRRQRRCAPAHPRSFNSRQPGVGPRRPARGFYARPRIAQLRVYVADVTTARQPS